MPPSDARNLADPGLRVWNARLSVPLDPAGDSTPVVRGFEAELSPEGFVRILATRGATGRLLDDALEVGFQAPRLPAVTARITLTPVEGRLRAEIVDLRLAGLFSLGGIVGMALDWLGERIERQPGVRRVGQRAVEVDLAAAARDLPVQLETAVQAVRVTPQGIALVCG